MSKETVREIITKAVSDTDFRALLLSTPEQALTGYELTDSERQEFANLKADDLSLDAQELEERISKWGIGIGGGI